MVLALAVLAGCDAPPEPPPANGSAVADPLAARGHRVSRGAAAGYVDDELCRSCHPDLWDAYQEVGMARSFFRPRAANLIEDFDSPGFYHAASRRHYRLLRRGERLVMRRHQIDAAGRPINEIEQEVDWILGSGNHSRTYLFRTPFGELYQLPIAWYTQSGRWDMAPGFERPDHLGLNRLVRRECMFCHNAYPEVPAGSDAHHQPHRLPAELPEGIGCQRCHGPGAAHSRAAMREPVEPARLHQTIVNPGRLSPRLRDDVCYGCHMQPSTAIPGKRRFGRGDFSFRPGEPLSDYLVQMETVEPDRAPGDRFEINHHPYRLQQSRCHRESAGALSCLTCHDPHRKVSPGERAAHYRAACLGCHEVDACRLEEMASAADGGAPAADDCAGCHMPERRTQDVVLVVMTDHKISRRPGGPELLAPIERSEPLIEDVQPLDPMRAPAGPLGEVYRACAVEEVSGAAHATAVEWLERLLPEVRPRELEPYMVLARGLFNQRRLKRAQAILEAILERSPDYPTARELLGVAQAGQGRTEEGLALLRQAIARGQDRPEARYNLGQLLSRLGRHSEALPHLERAVEMRPNMAVAWLHLGRVQEGLGRPAAAERSHRQALAVEPSLGRAYLALARLLNERGRQSEARRYLVHGAEHARDPRPLVEALAEGASGQPASRRGDR